MPFLSRRKYGSYDAGWLQSLTAASAVNTVGAALEGIPPHSQHALYVLSGTGVSSGAVTLVGSIDQVNWFSTGVVLTTSGASTGYYGSTSSATPYVFPYVAAKITTVIGGGTVNAWVASSL